LLGHLRTRGPAVYQPQSMSGEEAGPLGVSTVLLEADAHAREAQCHSPALDGEKALVERADDVG
jgi:hypothetical protein